MRVVRGVSADALGRVASRYRRRTKYGPYSPDLLPSWPGPGNGRGDVGEIGIIEDGVFAGSRDSQLRGDEQQGSGLWWPRWVASARKVGRTGEKR